MPYKNRKLRDLSYKIFFEQTFDPIALYEVVTEKGNEIVKFLDVNPAYERVMGVKLEDVVGKSFKEVWPVVEDCWHDIIKECIKSHKNVSTSSKCNQISKYLEAIAFPILPDKVAVIFLDRTKWKKSNEKLREKHKLLLEYREELRTLATKLTLAEEETRRDIASQIHDKLGYSMISLLHLIKKLQSEGCNQPDLSQAVESVEELIAHSRDLIFQVSSPALYDIGLNPALEALAEHTLLPHNIKFDFQGGNLDKQADDDICILLYQMTRELLINIVKHAEADNVSIRVHRSSNKIQVVVEDNGKGLPDDFELKWGKLKGFGLFSIRERLHPIGGSIQIISEPGKGATIAMTAPLKTSLSAQKGEHNDRHHPGR